MGILTILPNHKQITRKEICQFPGHDGGEKGIKGKGDPQRLDQDNQMDDDKQPRVWRGFSQRTTISLRTD